MQKTLEIRCGSCGRKLGEGIYQVLSIKCPRCGTLNSLRALSPTPERQGAPDLKDCLDGKPNRSLDRRQAPSSRPAAGQVSPS
ncbi:Com family DNA-binding transcriptional regulator [Comamonas piscis]